MKIVFLITLLANITFFFWQMNSGALNSLSDESGADIKESKQILLLKELSAKEQGKKIKTPEVNKTVVPPRTKAEKSKNGDSKLIKKVHGKVVDKSENQVGNDVINNAAMNNSVTLTEKQTVHENYCYQVGAFKAANELESWRKLNNIKLTSLFQFNKENQNVITYMVYYPVAENNTESDKNIKMLADKGINDYWLIQNGKHKGMISLGSFASEERALLLQEELVNNGVNVEIKQRSETKSAIYAQITTKNKTLKDSLAIPEKLTLSECEMNSPVQTESNSMVSL